jgi:hypothetical protein
MHSSRPNILSILFSDTFSVRYSIQVAAHNMIFIRF